MTKTLTEQWKDGELELNSLWFVRLPSGRYDKCFYTGSIIFMKSIHGYDEKIEQVLDKVPFYEEYKKLKEQLKEANRVIKRELRRQSPKGGVLLGDMNDYLKKWGVK